MREEGDLISGSLLGMKKCGGVAATGRQLPTLDHHILFLALHSVTQISIKLTLTDIYIS